MKKMRNKGRKRILPSLVSAMLMTSGLFQLATPILAQITAGGQTINNTGTATYQDDNGNTINSTSNTVTITVAEVAGITVSAQIPIDQNGGSVNTGDTLDFDFVVTNVGNDPTQIFLPGDGNIATIGANITSVEVIEVNGAPITAVPIPAAGNTTGALNVTPGGNTPAGSFNPGENLKVRVTTTVTETNAGGEISVRYGNTGVNNATTNNGPDTQNQPDNVAAPAGDGAANPDDVRTEDNTDPGTFTPGGEVIGDPINGEREAAGFSSVTLAAQVRPLALATILKTRGTVNNNGTLNVVNDDIIPYDLVLNVSAGNVGAFTAGNLEGTSIQLDTTTATGTAPQTVDRVLVSDAIPAGTALTGVPIAPLNWQVVYSTSALPVPNPVAPATVSEGTVPVNDAPFTAPATAPVAAVWQTTPPADLSTVTRVGFIFDTTTNGVINAGANIPGFQFQVVTSGLDPTAGGTVANIAQVFGQTQNDPTNEIVYDESGDRNPNNFTVDGAGNPTIPPDAAGDNTGTDYRPSAANNDDTGIAQPAKDGTDNNNDNTGLDNDPAPGGDPSGIAGGEANVINIGVNATGDILNGPNLQAGAIGPVDNNDDFTNLSIFDNAAPGIQGTPLNNAGLIPDPGIVEFQNTVQNPTAGNLDNVILEPLAPSVIQAATAAVNQFGVIIDPTTGNDAPGSATDGAAGDLAIPNGTIVTITPDGVPVAAVSYIYVAPAGGNPGRFDVVGGGNPLNIGTLAPGASLNYTVDIELPDNIVNQNREIPVPIIAFPDNDGNGQFDVGGDTVFNVTVDRVYTGYLRLVKRARLLAADGVTELQPFSADPFNSVANDGEPVWTQGPQPGEIIEYEVGYTNISVQAPVGGNGNVIINANTVVITENGTGVSFTDINGNTVNNNWALDNNADTIIDTSNIVGTAVASQGTVQFFSGPNPIPAAPATPTPGVDQRGNNQATDVTAYTNTVGQVIPQGTGTFTFRRQLPAQP